jgi:hypothetical protein
LGVKVPVRWSSVRIPDDEAVSVTSLILGWAKASVLSRSKVPMLKKFNPLLPERRFSFKLESVELDLFSIMALKILSIECCI